MCDTDWTVKEITPSEGYLLNATVYKVGANPKDYTVEYNNAPDMTVKEQVIKGNIAIIKHTDDGSTQIETPEKGAEFQIYLKSAGSYAEAKATEKNTIVCDEDGFGSCKLLPYGVYTVHQTKGWAGRELIKDFDVFINKDGNGALLAWRWILSFRSFDFYNYLADERHLKPATIDNIHTVLHQILDMAVDDDYLRNNPSNNVLKELKQSHCFQTEKRRALTRPEQELFLGYLKDTPSSSLWYPVFAVLIGTGLRVGEATGLRWCDIDLDEEIINVNHTLVYYDHRTDGSSF